jgi:hypothetical protein
LSTFTRLIQSTRFWTALVGLSTVLAVQLGGISQDKANAISAAVLGFVVTLIAAYTASPTPNSGNSTDVVPDNFTITPVNGQKEN